MKMMKRMLAMLLALVIVVGLVPASVFAADSLLAAAIFASDVHEKQTDLTGSGTSDWKAVLGAIAKNGVTYNTVGLVGDTYTDVAGTMADMTSATQAALGQNAEVYYAYGDHDSKSDISSASGLQYSGDHYYIYHLSDANMRSSAGANSTNVSAAIGAFQTAVESMDKTKVLFIMSHVPLHARRDDNTYANDWYTAIAAVAETMDVVVFWAHNHTGDNEVDQAAYYVAKDGDETMTIEGGSTVTPNFTYMNAGYINANGQNPARIGVATTVEIYANSMVFQDYSSSGEYSGTYAHNVTVTREFASSGSTDTTKTLASITAIPGQVVYMKGATFEYPSLVTAFYSDGTYAEMDPTGDTYTIDISGYDLSTSGIQTVNVSYTEDNVTKTTSYEIIIADSITMSGVALAKNYTFDPDTVLDKDSLSLVLTYTYTIGDETGTYTLNTTGADEDYITGISVSSETLQVGTTVTINASGAAHGVDGTPSVTYTVLSTNDITSSTATPYIAVYPEKSTNTVTIGGTTTTYEEAYIYVLTSTLTAGKEYLIVNTNSATSSAYALINNSGNLGATNVTVNAAGAVTGYYTDTTGSTVYSASNPYIISDASAWTTSGANSTTLKNGSYYLRRGNKTALSLSTGESTTWTWNSSSNYLSNNGKNDTYYLRYSSGWGLSTSKNSVYFYEKVKVYKVTTVDTSVTYKVSTGNVEHIYSYTESTVDGETVYTPDLTKTESIVAAIMGNDTEVTNLGGSYSFQKVADPDNIIASVSDTGVITFTGNIGEARVKVAYTFTVDGTQYTIWQYITVTARAPYYTADIVHDPDADGTATSVEDVIQIKGLEAMAAGYQLSAVTYLNGEGDAITPSGLIWSSNNTSVLQVDENGKVTIKGEGTAQVTVYYQYTVNGEIQYATDIVTFSITKSPYTLPSDGTDDFPEYPNEGAVRFDKTATSVGSFSQTGIAQVELAMTGVPYTTGSEIDVVLMLDMTGSMSDTDDRIPATEAAAKAFVKSIVQNEDGAYNKNRVAVYTFNSGGQNGTDTTYELFALGTVSSDTELTALNTLIDGASDTQESGGTPYDTALEKCYNVLGDAKKDGTGNNRQQFCVFMSDGVPTDYEYITGTTHANYSSASSIAGMLTSSDDYCTRDTDYYYEYYSTQMKAADVTIYTVGLGLENTNQAWSDGTAAQCLNLASRLLNDISGPAGETTQPDAVGTSTLSKKDLYFYSIDDADAATQMESVFKAIAQKIVQAATDVRVEDAIGEDYSVIFSLPSGLEGVGIDDQEFYIQVVEYQLDPTTKERNGNSTVMLRVYLSFDSTTNTYKATCYKVTTTVTTVADTTAAKTETSTSTDSTTGAITTTTKVYDGKNLTTTIEVKTPVENTYTTTDGVVTVTSGAYVATGGDATSGYYVSSLITPYFTYARDSAGEEVLNWNFDELTSTEMALQYFVYLDNSGGVDPENAVPAGTYYTNKYATLTYFNFQGTEVQQKFPVPKMTWNGAQVNFTFYLVNDKGQPVNRSGKVVPFSEAVFVTDIFTQGMTWNDLEQYEGFEAALEAQDKLPTVFELYDPGASYNIHVFENEYGSNLNNHFVIGSSYDADDIAGGKRYTTYVYNAKSDATKYTDPGYYALNNEFWCVGYGTVNTDETSGLPVSYTAATGEVQILINYDGKLSGFTENEWKELGSNEQYAVVLINNAQHTVAVDTNSDGETDGYYLYYQDENGWYTLVQKEADALVNGGFDFANTTVAFAVVFKPRLETDTVVVDFGLDVDVNVMLNDTLAGGVIGVRPDAPDVSINEDVVSSGDVLRQNSADIYVTINGEKVLIGTATKQSLTTVRFSFNRENGMQLNQSAIFYYEAEVNYYATDSNGITTLKQDVLYSSVIVIPATSVYYEDDYVTLKTYVKNESGTFVENTEDSGWTPVTDDTTVDSTQDCDRPGFDMISDEYDANNAYGYDSAYLTSSKYSMGSAAAITVDSNTRGEATFTFYGTGFDIISLTDNTTGTLIVQVFKGSEANGTAVKTSIVDTYFGYAYVDGAWVTVDSNDPNALYQVPVMKIFDLEYGQYTVKLTAGYNEYFDQTGDGKYTLYLDAIRIYDPVDPSIVLGVDAETDGENIYADDIYQEDNESWPEYTELRDLIISANDFDSLGDGTVSGVVFIDGATTDPDKTVSIQDYTNYGPNNELYLANGQAIAAVLDAGNAASVQLGIKSVGGTAKIEVYGIDANGNKTVAIADQAISTATDMYYDITVLNGMVLVVKNSGDTGIISITNIKCTYNAAPVYPTGLAIADETNATVTYSDKSTKTVAISELDAVTGDDGKITYTYTEKVNSKTYNVSCEVAAAAEASVMALSAVVGNATGLSLMSTATTYTVSADADNAESSKYLLSVNVAAAEQALLSLSAEEVEDEIVEDDTNTDAEPEIPVEPEVPEEPAVPEEPEKPEKPGRPGDHEKPGKPGRPGDHEKPGKPGKPGKGHSGRGHHHGEHTVDEPGVNHGWWHA